MADGFAEMLDQAMDFFDGLRSNNNRDWFEPRKALYIDQIRKPAELMAELIAEDLGRLTGQTYRPRVMRIYRDIRYSADKTPYNPHLRLLWEPATQAEGRFHPAFYFGAEPGRMVVGMGALGFDGPFLIRYREMVDDCGGELAELIDDSRAAIAVFGAPALKRVPAPYAADHPHGDLLRCKQLALFRDLAPDWRQLGALKAIRQGLEAFLPLHRFWMERLG